MDFESHYRASSIPLPFPPLCREPGNVILAAAEEGHSILQALALLPCFQAVGQRCERQNKEACVWSVGKVQLTWVRQREQSAEGESD